MTETTYDPHPNLLCRLGLHHWTADAHQGDDELDATWDCYCATCHRQRFDERGIATTRLGRTIDAVHQPIARLVYRIQRRLYRPPQYPTATPTPVAVTAPPTELRTTNAPVLMVFVNIKPRQGK